LSPEFSLHAVIAPFIRYDKKTRQRIVPGFLLIDASAYAADEAGSSADF